MPDTTYADIRKKFDPLWNVFDEFRNVRRDNWRSVVNRTFHPAIPKQILASAAEGFSLRSPKAEKVWKEHVKIATDNDTEIEFIDQEGTKDSQKDAENARLWTEVLWRTPEFNHAKRIDVGTAEQQIGPMGVSIWRLHAQLPKEGDFEYTDGSYEDARLDYYRSLKPWRLDLEDPLTCAWGPKLSDGEFEQFVQMGEVSWSALGELEDSEGVNAQDLFTLNELGYTGSVEDAEGAQRYLEGQKFDFVRYESLDKDESKKTGYPCWRFREFVQQQGKPQNAKDLKTGKLPFKHSSYFVVESGDATVSETSDPHWRYRTQIYPLLVLTHEKNMWDTLLAAMTYQALVDDRIVVRIDRLTPEGQQLFNQLGGELGGIEYEGEGASRVATLRLPRKGASDEVNVVPGPLEKWPTAESVIPAMQIRIEQLEREIEQELTNRWLVGAAYQETRESTSTMGVLQQQSAGVPYGPHIRNQDAIKEKVFRAILDCIIAWDEGSERYKPYPVTTTGKERKADPGKSITLTAEQAKRRFIIQCTTRVEGAQEKQLRQADAWARFDRGALLWEELLQELDVDDPHHYSMELDEESQLVQIQQEMMPVLAARRMVAVQNATGIDPARIQIVQMALSGGMQPQPGEPQGTQTGANEMPRPNDGPGTAPALSKPTGGGGGIG